ncbi:MAG: DUF2971 domain-containing protein [Rhodoferax sp.]|uniref:DUF2971 domain-containing protein n=1 Tax=Rhodoferax sp. TaxID=50421 RepID=UPI002ACDA3D7|nr:DUF2971 domain-containing protein [Rhodoferax sp.]MDZ7892444.1 DUF2971 domain-containing protein [Rhodoferax sp.]
MTIAPELLPIYKKVFFPYANEAVERMQAQGGRFAYYTTAATAMLILKSRAMWMRGTMVMNDSSEIEHGLSCVLSALKSDVGSQLEKVLDKQYPGLTKEVVDSFVAWAPGFSSDTFILCLSEHFSPDDAYGRLSMWRAYGGEAGVALVINGNVMFRESDALAAYSMPVAYLDERGLRKKLTELVSGIGMNVDLLKAIGRQATCNAIFNILRFATVCTKHPAFEEEREWRVVASPALQRSPLVPVTVEAVGGIPQRVLKIELKDHPDQGLIGLEPDKLVDRVLIGPCEHADAIG